ncbi:MAG: hypothetical protein ABJG78_09855 [Cyclobacteriaceae bacterium]
MQRIRTYLKAFCIVIIVGALFSCGDDDSSSDCGFSAVMEANQDFEAAVSAYSADPSDANCQALQNAIADFDSTAANVEVDCLNENDAANFVAWGIAVATTTADC